MKAKESIPTLKELIKQVEGTVIPDEAWYIMYPTELHKEQNSRWYVPGRELKAYIELNKDYTDLKMKLLWETYKDKTNNDGN